MQRPRKTILQLVEELRQLNDPPAELLAQELLGNLQRKNESRTNVHLRLVKTRLRYWEGHMQVAPDEEGERAVKFFKDIVAELKKDIQRERQLTRWARKRAINRIEKAKRKQEEEMRATVAPVTWEEMAGAVAELAPPPIIPNPPPIPSYTVFFQPWML